MKGPANLLDAFRVAASADSRDKGVLVVLNDEINSAREVAKTDALRVQTFQSRPYGILGVVDPDRVVYYRDPVKRHTQKTEFDVSTVTSLPRVDIMMFYQGASSDLLARVRRRRREGDRHCRRGRRSHRRVAGARHQLRRAATEWSSSRRRERAAAALPHNRQAACATG